MLGFIVNLSFRPRVAGLIRSQGAWQLVSMLGFAGESGRTALQQLGASLCAEDASPDDPQGS